jgi:cytochrome P450
MPEPSGPRWTQLFSVLNGWRKDQLAAFEQLARRHGDIVHIRLPTGRVYLLNHPDYLRHVLVTNRDNYLKPDVGRNVQRFFGSSMQLKNGDEARRLRRALNPVFLQSLTRDYCGVVVQATRAEASLWSTGPRPTLQHDLMELALTIAVQIHFGTQPGADTAGLAGLFREAQGYLSGVLPPDWLPLPANRRYHATVDALNREVYGRIARRRASGPTGPDLLSRFVSLPAELSDLEIRNELLSMMSAGHTSIGIALNQMMRQLASHPEVDDTLRDEISRVLQGRAATYQDLANLPYSEQVVKESLRLAPPAGVTTRLVRAEDEIGGWRVRGGSRVFSSAWVTQRDPRWFDEPLRFKPERWTAEFERTLPSGAYFPFGLGPRACIAGGLSTGILRLVLVTLTQQYRLRAGAARAASDAPRKFDLLAAIPKPEAEAAQPHGRENDLPVILENRGVMETAPHA